METDKKSRRSKLLYAGVIAVLIVFFIVGFVYGLDSVLKMEGSFPPVELSEAKTAVPETKEEAVEYLNRAVAAAKAEKPKFSSDSWFSIDEDSVSASGEDAIKNTLLFVREGLTDKLNESFDRFETDFSEGFDGYLRVPDFSPDDVEAFSCDYIYYKCSLCGETSDIPLDGCEACGSDYPYQMLYRDDYTITFELKNGDEVLKKNFTVRSDEEIRSLFGNELDDIMTIEKIDVSHTALTVKMKIDRTTDELKSLTYENKIPVHISASWKILPERELDLKADVTETEKYSFTWPEISLSEHTLDIEPKNTDNLLATLTFPSASQDNVVWTSSDENIVTVDDEGYMKAGKEPGTATVTASYDFNGKTYSDSCLINVKFDVESVVLNKRKLTINKGDSFTLSAKISPKKASVKTVKWYSENEDIATVDENGGVTALESGVVTVYALSDDLYFKASCEVTVK